MKWTLAAGPGQCVKDLGGPPAGVEPRLSEEASNFGECTVECGVLQFHPEPLCVLRTPLLGLRTWVDWASRDPVEARALLAEVVQRPTVREALYLASPSLLDDVALWQKSP